MKKVDEPTVFNTTHLGSKLHADHLVMLEVSEPGVEELTLGDCKGLYEATRHECEDEIALFDQVFVFVEGHGGFEKSLIAACTGIVMG